MTPGTPIALAHGLVAAVRTQQLDELIRRAAYELAADRVTLMTDGHLNDVDGTLECGKCGAAAGPGEMFEHMAGCIVGFVLTTLFAYGGRDEQPERVIQTVTPVRQLTHEEAAAERASLNPWAAAANRALNGRLDG